MLENGFKEGMRAAEPPARTATPRRGRFERRGKSWTRGDVGHLVGLTKGKNVSGQAECRGDGRDHRSVDACVSVRRVRWRRAGSVFFGTPLTPVRSPSNGKFGDIGQTDVRKVGW